MSTLKYCCGDKGVWKCDEPDHMLSLDRFSNDKYSKDGKQTMCKKCHQGYDAIRWTKRPKHPVTGEVKKHWKHRIAIELGGKPNKRLTKYEVDMWQSYLDKAEVAWDQEVKSHLLNTASAEEVLAHIEKRSFPKLKDKKPKFNQGKYKSPLARAVAKSKVKQSPGFAREGPGFVYVYEDEMKMPGVLKIGSTQYSNGRLTSANTWGAFTCLYEKEFERRYEAEDMVHDILEYCRIYRDKEWFRVTLTVAIEAIGEVRIDIRKKQKVG